MKENIKAARGGGGGGGGRVRFTTTIPLSAVYMVPHHRHGTAQHTRVCSHLPTRHMWIRVSSLPQLSSAFKMKSEPIGCDVHGLS